MDDGLSQQIAEGMREIIAAMPTVEEAGAALIAMNEACPVTDKELATYQWRLSPEGTRWAERERMRIVGRR